MTRGLALLALLAPVLALADPLPPPPAGEKHLALLPGQTLVLECDKDPCPTITLAADPADPRFGGTYTSSALTRWDLDWKHHIEAERDAAKALAYAAKPPGIRLLGIGFGVGVAAGGTAAAYLVGGSAGVKVASAAGSAVVGAVLIYLLR
jgi:hypothetical protein